MPPSGQMLGTALVLLYALLAVAPLLVAAAVEPRGGHALLTEFGRALALVGIMVLVLQYILAARLGWIERPFGLDLVLRFHRLMGIFALAVLLAHPLLLAAGNRSGRVLFGANVPWHWWLGRIVLLLLVAHVLLSVYRRFTRLSFEAWRVTHDVLALLVLGLAFVHSGFAGGDFSNGGMQALWVVLPAVGGLMYAEHRFLRPRRLARQAYTVTDVTQETPDVWTIKLQPPAGVQRFDYLPGQYQFLTFHRGRGLPEQEHHWTISSSPTQQGFVTSTIKASGDFTATIGQTRAGDTATVQAPFGRFSYALHPRDHGDLVFVAGGIGITPLMSMLRHLRDVGDPRRVLLLYGNRTRNDIVFRDELAEMERSGSPALRVVHVLSRDADWTGECGRLDADGIARCCEAYQGGALHEKTYWICGPNALLSGAVAGLRNRGVPAGRIVAEAFDFIDTAAPRERRGTRLRRVTLVVWLFLLLAAAAIAALRAAAAPAEPPHGLEAKPSQEPMTDPAHGEAAPHAH